jgi:hypothetical protein
VAELIHDQQVVVWLMDSYIGSVAHLALAELDPETLYLAYSDKYRGLYPEADFENFAAWLDQHSMYVRLASDWRPTTSNDADTREFIEGEYPIERAFATKWAVDLVSGAEEQYFDWNRADDLIIRVTLMIQRSTPFFLEDEDDD